MSKLPKEHRFIDFSDYGRPLARLIANSLKNTSFTPIHVTISFIISGLFGVFFILKGYYWYAAFFLILKSILDAADGELARIKKQPSYTGRYFDSISDIILNALIFISIWLVVNTNVWILVFSFFGLQLQGTLYNYYYTILRNKLNGDKTSRIFEDKAPIALEGEKQNNVNTCFFIYKFLYGTFDKIIYKLDKNAQIDCKIPNWLMTCISTFGLGFQLLFISAILVIGFIDFILYFFLIYTVFCLYFYRDTQRFFIR
ncbi:MAG: CDP-alcohol phosphatidyltransferase [Cryomorphaceae bacterium]|nr:MAG: CDP-alcohol phosphatidyltransferase [Cryomorphaceae bacterium]